MKKTQSQLQMFYEEGHKVTMKMLADSIRARDIQRRVLIANEAWEELQLFDAETDRQLEILWGMR